MICSAFTNPIRTVLTNAIKPPAIVNESTMFILEAWHERRRKVAKRVRVGDKRVWLLSGRVCRDCSAEFQGTVRAHFCWPCQLRRHGHRVDEAPVHMIIWWKMS